MNRTYELFIGSNNTTHEVELTKIENILNKYFEGYTVKSAVGYWRGARENSVAVTFICDPSTLIKVLKEVKVGLIQDSIAYHSVAQLKFY
jgi:hypothetical protein